MKNENFFFSHNSESQFVRETVLKHYFPKYAYQKETKLFVLESRIALVKLVMRIINIKSETIG